MQIKSIIIKALQSYEPPKEAVAAASPAAVLAAAASGGPAPGVPPPVGHCISRMTNHVFLHCLQVSMSQLFHTTIACACLMVLAMSHREASALLLAGKAWQNALRLIASAEVTA